MSKQHDGGPAFPTATLAQKTEGGMTLLDYFAAKFMQAYITSQIDMTSKKTSTFAEENVAKIAYQFADAMILAREQ